MNPSDAARAEEDDHRMEIDEDPGDQGGSSQDPEDDVPQSPVSDDGTDWGSLVGDEFEAEGAERKKLVRELAKKYNEAVKSQSKNHAKRLRSELDLARRRVARFDEQDAIRAEAKFGAKPKAKKAVKVSVNGQEVEVRRSERERTDTAREPEDTENKWHPGFRLLRSAGQRGDADLAEFGCHLTDLSTQVFERLDDARNAAIDYETWLKKEIKKSTDPAKKKLLQEELTAFEEDLTVAIDRIEAYSHKEADLRVIHDHIFAVLNSFPEFEEKKIVRIERAIEEAIAAYTKAFNAAERRTNSMSTANKLRADDAVNALIFLPLLRCKCARALLCKSTSEMETMLEKVATEEKEIRDLVNSLIHDEKASVEAVTKRLTAISKFDDTPTLVVAAYLRADREKVVERLGQIMKNKRKIRDAIKDLLDLEYERRSSLYADMYTEETIDAVLGDFLLQFDTGEHKKQVDEDFESDECEDEEDEEDDDVPFTDDDDDEDEDEESLVEEEDEETSASQESSLSDERPAKKQKKISPSNSTARPSSTPSPMSLSVNPRAHGAARPRAPGESPAKKHKVDRKNSTAPGPPPRPPSAPRGESPVKKQNVDQKVDQKNSTAPPRPPPAPPGESPVKKKNSTAPPRPPPAPPGESTVKKPPSVSAHRLLQQGRARPADNAHGSH